MEKNGVQQVLYLLCFVQALVIGGKTPRRFTPYYLGVDLLLSMLHGRCRGIAARNGTIRAGNRV